MRISDWSSDLCSSDLQHGQEAAAGAGVERLGAAQRAGVEQLHPDLEAAQYAFEAIQGHVLSDLHGTVAESYPIEQTGARHCPPRRIPRHPKETFQFPGFPPSIPAPPPRTPRQDPTKT